MVAKPIEYLWTLIYLPGEIFLYLVGMHQPGLDEEDYKSYIHSLKNLMMIFGFVGIVTSLPFLLVGITNVNLNFSFLDRLLISGWILILVYFAFFLSSHLRFYHREYHRIKKVKRDT